MSISATTNRVSQNGNGTTTDFSFPYPIHAAADLVVISTIIATGVQTTKTLTTHYTISGSADSLGHYPNGVTVTMLTAPASTERLTIYRDPALTQSVDLVENDPLPVEAAVEAPLDRLTMICQRFRDVDSRSLRQPEGDADAIDFLPAKVTRASKYLGFDSDGDPTALDAPAGTTAITAFVATLLDDTTAVAFRQTLLIDKHGADIASASTIDLDAATGDLIDVTGTTAITAITLAEGVEKTIRFTGALTFTHGASLVLPGAANITTVAGDFAVVRGYASGVVRCVHYERSASAVEATVGTLPRVASGPAIAYGAPGGHLYGLTLSNNGSDATNDIDIAIGEAASNGTTYASRVIMSLTSALTKRLDATWVAGTNQGGRTSSVAIANGTWHVFLMRVAGADDVGFDTSATGANLVTDHSATHLRRIGSILRESAAIVAFTQFGDVFERAVVLDVNASNPGTSAVTRTLSLPTGITVIALMNVYLRAHNAGEYENLTSLDITDVATTESGSAPLSSIGNNTVASGAVVAQIAVKTNTSGQIRSRANASGGVNHLLQIATRGWIDTRGRLA